MLRTYLFTVAFLVSAPLAHAADSARPPARAASGISLTPSEKKKIKKCEAETPDGVTVGGKMVWFTKAEKQNFYNLCMKRPG